MVKSIVCKNGLEVEAAFKVLKEEGFPIIEKFYGEKFIVSGSTSGQEISEERDKILKEG